MHRSVSVLCSCILLLQPAAARQERVICGTNREKWKEELHLHRQAERARKLARFESANAAAVPSPAAVHDVGDIVVLEDSDGVVARRNPFDLDRRTLTFTPAAARAASYKFRVSADSYDAAGASAGTAVTLGDDDSHQVTLPFSFPFFGNSYPSIFINSDGNLTFVSAESASTDRSLGRVVAGPPRIAPLFRDVDPSKTPQGVRFLSAPNRFVVSWTQVPEYSDFGMGLPQTFQMRLYPDGHIEFAYSGINTSGAVVGISPGEFRGSSSVVSFAAGSTSTYSSTIAERFGGDTEVDVETAAQKFYQTHDDAYDYLVFFNDESIQAAPGALAWESTLRNNRSGYGDGPVDIAEEYGSPSRLQAVLNMGPLGQYPVDPTEIVDLRASSGYNTLKLISHEAGHLFLAYASIRDAQNPNVLPMLGLQEAHWAFTFNAEASVMEGNRIKDNGPSASPRFVTTGTVEGYAPLDQYLMGFRAPEEVPQPLFLVNNSNPPIAPTRFPQVGVTFNGARRDIRLDEIIQAVGRRTPDSTVSQRHFRFGFVLIVKQGTTPPAAEIAQLESFRSQFEAFYPTAATHRAWADASLRHTLSLSLAPAAGVVQGSAAPASISIQAPAAAPLTVALQTQAGLIGVPASVTIPAGSTTANFPVHGMQPGVEEITAAPADSNFETAFARVQVAPPAALRLLTVSGDRQVASPGAPLAQPIVVRVSDINNLPYPGAVIQASSTAGGVVSPQAATADATSQVTFQWTPGTATAQLRLYPQGSDPSAGLVITPFGPPQFAASAVVNAASYAPGLTPDGIATIYGNNLAGGATAQAGFPWPATLAGVAVLVSGRASPMLFVSDSQVNFMAPADLAPGQASVTVSTPVGSFTAQVVVAPASPGIFFDSLTGFGAVLNAGTALTTLEHPAARGGYIEIYCTGLGAVRPSTPQGLRTTLEQPRVFIGLVEAKNITFSGLAPATDGGLYQINVQIPSGVPSGVQTLSVSMNGIASNVVKIGVQ